MKKGHKVVCIKASKNAPYLTEGKVYTVVKDTLYAKRLFNILSSEEEHFIVKSDNNEKILCTYPDDIHAEWQLVH